MKIELKLRLLVVLLKLGGRQRVDAADSWNVGSISLSILRKKVWTLRDPLGTSDRP
jgi:hypothetical protein